MMSISHGMLGISIADLEQAGMIIPYISVPVGYIS